MPPKWPCGGFSFYKPQIHDTNRWGGDSEQVTLSVTWKTHAEHRQNHVTAGREPTWVMAAQLLKSPGVALKDKRNNCDPEATKYSYNGLETPCQPQATHSKQFGKAVQAMSRLLRKKWPILTANDPEEPISPPLTSSPDITLRMLTVIFNISNYETAPSYS